MVGSGYINNRILSRLKEFATVKGVTFDAACERLFNSGELTDREISAILLNPGIFGEFPHLGYLMRTAEPVSGDLVVRATFTDILRHMALDDPQLADWVNDSTQALYS